MEEDSDELHVLAEGTMRLITCFILCVFISTHAQALTETFLRMKPNKDYMQFVLKKYLEWHEKKFPASYVNVPTQITGIFDEALHEIDHWKVPGLPEYAQISFDHRLVDEKYLSQSKRVFLPAKVRARAKSAGTSLPPEEDPLFLELFESGEFCFYTALKRSSKLRVHCQARESGKLKFAGEEFLSLELKGDWKNPFPFLLSHEVRRTDEAGGLVSISYQTKGAHPSLTPRGFDTLINSHVIEAALPFDRYRISSTGDMTVQYP